MDTAKAGPWVGSWPLLSLYMCVARPSWCRLFWQWARLAASRAFCTAGSSNPIRMAMMAMTTNNSISVNDGGCANLPSVLLRITIEDLQNSMGKTEKPREDNSSELSGWIQRQSREKCENCKISAPEA